MTRPSIHSFLFTAVLAFALQPAFAESTDSRAINSCRCLPSESCWPEPKSWNALQHQITGRLVKPVAELDACVTKADSKACRLALKNTHNPFHNENNPGNTQSQGWMNAWRNQASTYAVEAENAEDVVAAVNFARKHHLRVVIKGTGHDYLGRSNAPNSLLIWTHKMRAVTFDQAFIPAGCEDVKKGVQALTVGAGTRWLEAYDVATNQNNRYVQGGGCTTVGAAGGFTQGGGFGSFSKNFGTGAAGILQVEVVTADGKILTANRCQHPDLFWAIRGGGAGTFGVVTKMTLKTHALPATFGIYKETIKAANDQAYQALIREFISFYHSNLNNDHWGEQVRFSPDNSITMMLTFQGLSETQAIYTFSPLHAWIATHKELYAVEKSVITFPANKMWNLEYLTKNIPSLFTLNKETNAPKNQFWWASNSAEVSKYWFTYQSWWLPLHLFEESNKEKLANAIYQSSRLTNTNMHINKGLSGAPESVIDEVRKTATNPAVIDAAALIIMAAGNNAVYPDINGKEPDDEKGKKDVEAISKAINYFKQIAPDAGTYANESDYFLNDWQRAYWGANYEKLLDIKKKVDPEGVFYCHHCVGSEAWADDGMCKV